MNIFYLNADPKICAQWHVDKHCTKMILEYAQLLSTAHRVLDGIEELVPYTPITIKESYNIAFLHTKEWNDNPDYDREPELVYEIVPGKEKVRKDLTLYHQDIFMDDKLYRHTHQNHPSAVWVRERAGNYIWLHSLLCALLEEYTYRYGKIHKTAALAPYLARIPKNIYYDLERTDPTPAMPDEYKVEGDVAASYHAYYIGEKSDMFAWKNREPPSFIAA